MSKAEHNSERRIFKYIEEVERNNKSFQPIRGIRAIHRIETLDSKRVLIRNLSCYCESCIAADGVEPCLNLAQIGNSDETILRPDNDQETDRDDIVRGVASLFCSASNQTWKGGSGGVCLPRIFFVDLMQNGAF